MLRLSFPLVVMEDPSLAPKTPTPPSATRPRPWVREALLLCLGLKVLLLFLGWVVSEVRLDKPFRTTEEVLRIWYQWDSRHYLDIAANGYKAPGEGTTLVLPPLLPMLIRAASWITGSIPSAGVLVVTLISFLPGLLMYQLARCDLDEENAFRAMLVLLLFPSSFFIHIVYTEGLFLTTVLAAFLAARRGNWKAMAIFGVLAGLTRINAFVLAPALLFEAWGDERKGRLPRVLASLTVGLGIAVYLWINYATAGDPLAFLTVQRVSFYRTFAWPWQGAMNVWDLAAFGGSNGTMNGVLQVVCIPLLLAACVIAVIRQRASYAIWTIGQVLIFTTQGFWLSLPRLALVLFPAFVWLAPRTARPVFGTLWFAASTLFLSFLAGQFAQGWWVS